MFKICPRCLQQQFINDFYLGINTLPEKVIFLHFNFCKPKEKMRNTLFEGIARTICCFFFFFICCKAQHACTCTNSLKENKFHVLFEQQVRSASSLFSVPRVLLLEAISLVRLTLIIGFIVEKTTKATTQLCCVK